jgi:hypothetical protein
MAFDITERKRIEEEPLSAKDRWPARPLRHR